MPEKTVEIAIPILLPDVEDECDACIDTLQAMLQSHKGIVRTHLEVEHDPIDLCIHYDPNLISLAAVDRHSQSGWLRTEQRPSPRDDCLCWPGFG